MLKTIAGVLLFVASGLSNAACLSEAQLAKLNQQETDYLLGRIPPAFAHALADKKITISTKHASDAPCAATASITLPESELAEANQILDADIAKKIMLSAQGYGLPASTTVEATYQVDANTLTILPPEILQTAPLGNLRASVELMYATLTQARAKLSEPLQNNTPWQAVYKTQHIQKCSQNMTANSEVSQACSCQADGLEKAVSERQMDYLDYIKSNPYALATGSNRTYEQWLAKLNDQCGLKNK